MDAKCYLAERQECLTKIYGRDFIKYHKNFANFVGVIIKLP